MFDFLLHIDEWLRMMVDNYPIMIYALLFLIVFAESSFFPLAPFLPGDGLLFSIGVIAATSSLNLFIAIPVLFIGGILGNAVAYYAGGRYGEIIYQKFGISESQLEQTHEFYEKYGRLAFLFSRFVPIVRAIVPLIAGISKMPFGKFWTNNILSVAVWVISLVALGYQLGNVPFIKNHIGHIILGVSVVSLSSFVIVSIRRYRNAGK